MVVSQQHAIPTAATLFKTIDTLNEKEQLSIIVRLKDSLKSQPKQALSVLKIMASQSKPKITVLHSQVEFLTSIFQDADLDHLIADSLKVLELLINSNTKIATSILENFLEPYILLNAFDPKANVGVESDFSEWDNDDIPNTPIQRYEWKVQYQSLKCIIVLCKQVSKHMLPYWPKLLSSDSKSSRNVCRLAQSHPSKMVRKVCFELLQVMFDDCNGRYLSMASSDTKPTSFTSLSHSLSEILSVSNQYIIECFENDGDHVMLMKLYPAVCAMIRNSPLVKLREDYVQLWFHVLYDRINSNRLVVDEKCCLLNAFSQLVLHFVQGRHDLLLQRTISMLKEQIDHKSTSMTLKCFILQLIRSICQNYALVVWKDIEFYDLIMQEARFSKFKEMNLCYVQLVEQLAVGDLFDFLDVEWWINSLEHASVFFSNDFVKLRVHSCQLLGLVPKTVITQLPSRLIAFLKVSIVCLLRDENEEVRVAASSVLGSHWSELIFDDLIFLDEILNQLGINMVDNTSKVRAKSACAAGNILTIVKEHDLILQEDILLLIFNQSVKGLGEHEKVANIYLDQGSCVTLSWTRCSNVASKFHTIIEGTT